MRRNTTFVLVLVLVGAGAAGSETPAKPISAKGMSERQFQELPDSAQMEVSGKVVSVGKIRSDYAARWQAEKARARAKRVELASHAAAELRRLQGEADARHLKRLDESRQLVAGEIAKWKAAPGPDSLERKAAALKLREASAKTADEWLAIEREARELLAQGGR